MQRVIAPLAASSLAVLVTLAATSMTSRAAGEIKDGNKAKSRSYWFHYSNDNPKRAGVHGPKNPAW